MSVSSVTTTKIDGIEYVFGGWSNTMELTLDSGDKVEIVVDSLKTAEDLRDAANRQIERLIKRQREQAEKLLEKEVVED